MTLDASGGHSQAPSAVRTAGDKLRGGNVHAIVVPDAPSVISVGELCVDHGCSFNWGAGGVPRLLLPSGRRLDLAVDGKIPYLSMEGRGAMGQVDEAVPGSLAGLA
eukprot:7756918-Pyramimonas_sp.AAC.1